MNNELMAIQKECRRRQKELSHTIDARARTAAAIDNHGWCDLHIDELALNYKAKCDDYWRKFTQWFGEVPENPTEREIDDQIHEAGTYKFGRFAFLAVETIAGAVLAVMFLNAPRLMAMIMGVALAVLLGGAGAAVVTRWVKNAAADQPTKQLERITRGLIILGLLCVAAIVTALAILRGQGFALGGFLFSIATTAVTLLAPLCSGLCGYAAKLLLWSKRLCADLRAIRSLARELDHLLTTSDRSIPPGTGGGAPPNPVSRVLRAIAPPAAAFLRTPNPLNRVLRAITPVALALFVIAALLATPTIGLAAGDTMIYLYPDVSPSARAGDVIRVLKNFSGRLSNYDGDNTLVITMVPFFEDAFMASPMVRVAIPGNRPIACASAGNTSEIGQLSKSYADAARREAERQCAERRSQALREDTTRRSAEIAKLAAAIDQLPGLKLPGRCTAVNAMIRRAARETPNGISIVVSDLVSSCAKGLPANLQPDNQVFIIPVGSLQRPIEDGFDAIQARFAQTMPAVRVVEPYRLDTIINAITHPESRVAARR